MDVPIAFHSRRILDREYTTDESRHVNDRPKDIKVDVRNPNYEGATFEMVVKAMLQRPKKADQKVNDKPPDEPESGGAQSST